MAASAGGIYAPSSSNGFLQPFSNLNRQYPLSNEHIPVWMAQQSRILKYLLFWKFYNGNQWERPSSPGEPNITANYVRKFVDKHNAFLFGQGFTIHSNFGGATFQQTEDLLNQNWEKNSLKLTALEMGQIGGITGDCWVNVGLEEDPIFGSRVRYTVIPSEYVFPIFRHNTSRTFDALLIQWPDVQIVQNSFGKIRTKTVTRSWYWTKDSFWELENGEPLSEAQKNYLGEIPFVHIANTTVATQFWGASDIEQIVDLQRDLNSKYTDCSEIIDYHASPITIIYGAKAAALQKGAKKVWSNLPKDAKVENLQLTGDLGASVKYIEQLRQALFQLGDMSSTAFGGAEAISNTSGVALALQFAPLLEHMKLRRVTYEAGIQRINYLTLKFLELMGYYKANGRPMPYYSGVIWSSPLPRDAANEMQLLMQMLQNQLLSRVQVLSQLITEEIAPNQFETSDAEDLVKQAMDEQLKWTEQYGEAQLAPQVAAQEEMAPAQGTPASAPQAKHNSVSAAETASRKSEQNSKKEAGL